MFFPISGRHVVAHVHGHQHGVSILISINLCETLCQITRVWNTAQTWGLDRVLIYLSSIACKFLDFIHWMVFDFYFDGVTVKTGNIRPWRCSRKPKLIDSYTRSKELDFFSRRTDVHWFPARTSERSTCNRQVIYNLFLFIVAFTNKKDRTITSPLVELSSWQYIEFVLSYI